MNRPPTKAALLTKGLEAAAKGLVEFGYPDATAAMIREAHTAWQAGEDLPHGIIGMFAERSFDDHPEIFGTQGDAAED